MKGYYKIFISVILILALLFSFSFSAFANPLAPVAADLLLAGGLAALISGLVGLSFNGAADQIAVATGISNAPSNISDFAVQVINNPLGTAQVFINKAFADWLFGDILGFVDDIGLVDNDTITFYTSVGSINGIPLLTPQVWSIYPLSGPWDTEYGSSFSWSGYGITWSYSGGRGWDFSYAGTDYHGASHGDVSYLGVLFKNNVWSLVVKTSSTGSSTVYTFDSPTVIMQGSDLEVSSTIIEDAPEISTNGGVLLTLPSSIPSDATLPDILEIINELFEEGETVPVEIVEEAPPEPVPPSETTIADQYYYILQQQLLDLGYSIDEVHDLIGLFKDSVEEFADLVGLDLAEIQDTIDLVGQSAIDELEEQTGYLESIDTYGQSAVEELEGVNSGILGLGDILSDILDSLGDIAQAIETALVDVFMAFINGFELAFSDLLSALKSALGIWHYVVEWLASISGVFAFFWSIASGTSYYIVLPIYACVAAAICLAVYKRFGR